MIIFFILFKQLLLFLLEASSEDLIFWHIFTKKCKTLRGVVDTGESRLHNMLPTPWSRRHCKIFKPRKICHSPQSINQTLIKQTSGEFYHQLHKHEVHVLKNSLINSKSFLGTSNRTWESCLVKEPKVGKKILWHYLFNDIGFFAISGINILEVTAYLFPLNWTNIP